MTRQEFRSFYATNFPDLGLFVNFTELCRVLGMTSKTVKLLINRNGVDYYRPAGRKLYNVEEVFLQIQSTKNLR